MKTYMTTSEQKAYSVGYLLAMVLMQAVNVAIAVVAIIMIRKSNWLGLGAVILAKPLAGMAVVAVIIVLDLILMGICKLLLKIMDRH